MASFIDNIPTAGWIVLTSIFTALTTGVLLRWNDRIVKRRERAEDRAEKAAAARPRPLTDDELTIIRGMYEKPGRTALRVHVFGKPEHIQAGTAELWDANDPTVAERYIVAFESLIARGIIRYRVQIVYEFTGPGLELAMKLFKEAA